MDQEQNEVLSKKERRDQKRENRDSELARAVRIRMMLRVLPWVALAVVVIAVAFGAWKFFRATGRAPESIGSDFSREFADQGEVHMKEGERAKDLYNSNPPTSGPHWPEGVRDGIYDRSQPDEGLIHSLEHGRIWISYKSSIPESAKEAINKLAGSQTKVIVTVRDANDTDITLAKWRRLDTFNLNQDGGFDEQRILDFIKRYRDTAPEKGIPANASGKVYD